MTSSARLTFVAATMRTSIRRDLPLAAEPLDLALLQDAQQLDLHVARDLADLVEEQRAAVRGLEAAVARRAPRR